MFSMDAWQLALLLALVAGAAAACGFWLARRTGTHTKARTAAQLQELSDRFAAVFRDSPVAVVIGRLPEGRVSDANPAAAALTGYSREELVGASGNDLSLWAKDADRMTVRTTLAGGGQVRGLQTQFRRKNGELIDISLSCSCVLAGGQQHYFSLAQDVTAEVRARRELEAHRAQLEDIVRERTAALATANASLAERTRVVTALYDGAPCGYISLSAQGRVTEANSTALRMLGQERSALVGRPLMELMTPASRALHRIRTQVFNVEGHARALVYDFVRADGSAFAALLDADAERDAQGRIVGVRAMLVDDSDRRRREAQIAAMQSELARRAELAEAANRAKSAFVANMSHEIRTPLNAIIGLTRLMQPQAQDERQRDRLGKVSASAEHLLKVINDVLDLSKIEAGKMSLSSSDFTLGTLLESVCSMVAEAARVKGLALQVQAQGLPPHWHGDATRLAQALLNLLSNAVKFTASGHVTLRVTLGGQRGQTRRLRFEVQDSGEGISADRLPHLFQAFEQADTSMARRHGGTGLGLALTRHLAQMMGGEVGVFSEAGKGSTFWFTAWLQVLGVADAEPAATAGPIVGHVQGRHEGELRERHAGARVLLAEDNPVNQEVACAVLQAAGLVVDVVGDGAAAVAAVLRQPYALVLMDMQMPGVDGLSATRQIRATDAAQLPRQPPIVAMTANAFGEDRDACLAAGMNDHIAKPVDAEELYRTLLNWLG